MANSKAFIEQVVDLFASFEPVTTRPMFGGVSLMVDGMMLGFLDDDELFLKVDAESTPRFTAAGCKQFTYPTKQGPMPMAYYQPPPETLEDARELRPWFDLAMGAAVRKQAIKEAKASEQQARREARLAAAAAKAAAKAQGPAPRKAAKPAARSAIKSVTKPVAKKAARRAGAKTAKKQLTPAAEKKAAPARKKAAPARKQRPSRK
jgi:DNA transformation protein